MPGSAPEVASAVTCPTADSAWASWATCGAQVVDVVALVQAYLDGFGKSGDAAAEDRQRDRGGAGRLDDVGAGCLLGHGERHGAGETG